MKKRDKYVTIGMVLLTMSIMVMYFFMVLNHEQPKRETLKISHNASTLQIPEIDIDFQEVVELHSAGSLEKKLEEFKINSKTDMSKSLGLTESEIRILLSNSGLVKDSEIIEVLPKIMVQTVAENEVNELFSIAVMSYETGYFDSKLARNKNNFGGMMLNGRAMSFETKEEGLEKAIICAHNNLRGNNTANDVERSYCPDNQYWSNNVISIMKMYAEPSK